MRARDAVFDEDRGESKCMLTPPLAIRLLADTEVTEPGEIALQGQWPERIEATAGRLERIVYEGSLSLGRRYLFDEAHGEHVAMLAVSLFDQLLDVHQLAPDDRRVLLAGALLHDIGQHISYSKHHKHSLYLILHSEIPGIAPDELPFVALVARYHRRAEPREDQFLYRDMSPRDRKRVERMAAILRLADSLDREHLQRVHSVEARIHDDRLELHLDKDGRLLLEQWALRKKGKPVDCPSCGAAKVPSHKMRGRVERGKKVIWDCVKCRNSKLEAARKVLWGCSWCCEEEMVTPPEARRTFCGKRCLGAWRKAKRRAKEEKQAAGLRGES